MELEKGMTNKETAEWIRRYYAEKMDANFSWPTDACGYDQHIRFVEHRNKNWNGVTQGEFKEFALKYAEDLEREP